MKASLYVLMILALLFTPWLSYSSSASARVIDDGPHAPAQETLFAKPTGTGDCSTWEDACELQTALGNASSGDEIWVQAGIHKPTTGSDRTVSLH